jgi:hypothetical protein
MSRYKLILRCNNFKHGPHKYTRTVDVDEEAGELLSDVPNPPCPLCSKMIKKRDEEIMGTPPLPHMGMDSIIESGQAPGIVGANNQVKAIDLTAEIVMKDHNMTNLRTDIRAGEAMAPRLPPAQQKAADNFFNPGAGLQNKQARIKMQRLGQRAINGAFRHHAVDVKSVLPDARVALHKTGEQPVR